MIKVSKPLIGIEEIEEIRKVFDSNWLGLGSTVFEFEEAIKEFLGAKNIIAVNTGTSALHITLDSFGIKKDDEVIVPSLTYCATIQAITALQAIPIFCDINQNTLNIDTDDVKKKITPKTKAIIPIHYCGSSCDMETLLSFNISVIEDAAHAFGSSYNGKKLGSFGDATCFSFDPIKTLTCGEGGAISISDDEIADNIRRKRILGIDKDTWNRYKNKRNWYYEVVSQGYRYHMSNINAAIGLAQLKKFNMFSEFRKEIVDKYNKGFKNIDSVKILDWNLNETVPFIYILRVIKRDTLINFLNDRGIETGIHYIPNHLQPFFKQYKTSLPVTEKLYGEIITLPLYVGLELSKVDYIINSVREFYNGKI